MGLASKMGLDSYPVSLARPEMFKLMKAIRKDYDGRSSVICLGPEEIAKAQEELGIHLDIGSAHKNFNRSEEGYEVDALNTLKAGFAGLADIYSSPGTLARHFNGFDVSIFYEDAPPESLPKSGKIKYFFMKTMKAPGEFESAACGLAETGMLAWMHSWSQAAGPMDELHIRMGLKDNSKLLPLQAEMCELYGISPKQ
jgi:hypothetical protein